MKLKDAENIKALANFTSFILMIVGLILQDYIWLVAALICRSTTITLVIHHKKPPAPSGGHTKKFRSHMDDSLEQMAKLNFKDVGHKVRGRL